MASLNRISIIGYVGQDPEIKYSQSGTAFCKFSVATTDVFFDKKTETKTKNTDWHNIVTFGKTAENCERYISKGDQVYIEGKLKSGSYEKDGITHYTTDVIAHSVLSLERRQGTSDGNYSGHQPKQRYDQPKQQDFSDIPAEDDIPF